MSYHSINQMAGSQSLIARVAAAAAAEDIPEHPVQWAQANIWRIAAEPGWANAWQYAVDTLNINQNPDIGQRDDVVNDSMILAAVQALKAEQYPPTA